MLPFTDTRAFSRSYVPGTGTARPCSVTSVASGPWSPGWTSSRTRIEPMLQNINCASPVAASTATRTLGRSARTSWPCETFASSNRSRSLNDCDCAVMRASIRHLLLNVVVRAAGSESSLTGGSRERGAGRSTQPCDWSGVLYTVGLVDAPRLMPIRPRLTRPPRIIIASDQNHALSDVVRSLGRRGYSVLRVFAEASVLERARTARPDVIVLDAALGEEQALDLSRTLRADPSIGSSTPILLLVPGRPSREHHLTALRAGVWALVRQPLAVVAAGVNRAGARQLAKRLRDSVGAELRAGYDAVGSRRAGGGGLEARSLVARAARALEMAKLEGKWVKEARE